MLQDLGEPLERQQSESKTIARESTADDAWFQPAAGTTVTRSPPEPAMGHRTRRRLAEFG
jgi:hypothetical protein